MRNGWNFVRERYRLQSAMEYLMTYGWAILVIAVVLGVLYSLGIFNPSNFAPKAQPGSCQVFRPNGPGTNYNLQLEGTCNNELPQYAAVFNAEHSNVFADLYGLPTLTDSGGNITILAWAALTPAGGNQVLFQYTPSGGYYPNLKELADAFCSSNPTGLPIYYSSSSYYVDECLSQIAPNQLEFYALTFNGTRLTGYEISGGQVTPHSVSVTMGSNSLQANGQLYIGGGPGATGWTGTISNVQVYNASLSENVIEAQYLEGVGGAPIRLQNLVAWYPLNGNANDYSGNNNNGVQANVVYTGTWQSEYASP